MDGNESIIFKSWNENKVMIKMIGSRTVKKLSKMESHFFLTIDRYFFSSGFRKMLKSMAKTIGIIIVEPIVNKYPAARIMKR